MTRLRNSARQRGVAVVTALLLTTLAITIVASLFWQQQVQVRSIENQRLQLQKQWILRGALDWTRLILREDARISSGVDHLGEPWATPLAETRLDQYVENSGTSGEAPDAVLSGGIVDAQSRFNLTNLCQGGQIRQEEVAAFAKLLTNLQQNPALARATAAAMKAAQGRTASTAPASAESASGASGASAVATTASSGSDTAQPLDILYVDDLLAVPGFTPAVLEAIRDFVVVLPTFTYVNVNTAPAEVLSARIATLSLADAAAVVAMRETAWFRNPTDFQTRALQDKVKNPEEMQRTMANLSVSTNYFLINGNVRLNRATMRMQALIERMGSPRVLWIRES